MEVGPEEVEMVSFFKPHLGATLIHHVSGLYSVISKDLVQS